MEQYCMYLRKSRADAEAEAHGEGETLARHERILIDLAKRQNLLVTKIYREIVSGDTIAARPMMLQLLQEVEQGIWAGVLVVEVERLARGNTIDQGIMAQTFKFGETKIVTPLKTYDPNNEFDEEYFEFGLFMSRRELKTINRRLQRGRLAAVQEGKFCGSVAPYGFRRIKLTYTTGFTLEPIPEEAEIVWIIFDWYTVGVLVPDGTYRRLGVSLIAKRLNDMGVPTRKGGDWVAATIRDVLTNPVYAGFIRWGWRPHAKAMVNGQITSERPRVDKEKCILVKGLHPAIVTTETFDLAQDLMSQNPPRPVGERHTVKNPLAGIVICGKCGRRMVRRPYSDRTTRDTLMCPHSRCPNVSVALKMVEDRILQGLAEWLGKYKLKIGESDSKRANAGAGQIEVKQKALKKLQGELSTLQKQMGNIHDLLEQGVYDTATFLDRSRSLADRMKATENSVSALEAEIQEEADREKGRRKIIPKIENLLAVYHSLPTPAAKNEMLKDVLEKVVYVKERSARFKGIAEDDFEIGLYPKLPNSHA